jgi:hypothetical protein
MSDLARLRIWDDPAIRGALSWYLDVAENRRPAKFRIAATVATQLDPAASGEGALWAELGDQMDLHIDTLADPTRRRIVEALRNGETGRLVPFTLQCRLKTFF